MSMLRHAGLICLFIWLSVCLSRAGPHGLHQHGDSLQRTLRPGHALASFRILFSVEHATAASFRSTVLLMTSAVQMQHKRMSRHAPLFFSKAPPDGACCAGGGAGQLSLHAVVCSSRRGRACSEVCAAAEPRVGLVLGELLAAMCVRPDPAIKL